MGTVSQMPRGKHRTAVDVSPTRLYVPAPTHRFGVGHFVEPEEGAMAAWRTLGSLVVALVAVGAAQAQSYSLKEDPPVDTRAKIKLTLALSGELKVQQEGKTLSLKESAVAAHEYAERVLKGGTPGLPDRAARSYQTAKVAITVNGVRTERSLRPERYLMGLERVKEALLAYSPSGPLTREELQLTEHLDTLAVSGLLPANDVKVGDIWKPANPVVQALCHFDGLTGQDLTCKLEQVKDDTATVSVTGVAGGIDLGAAVKVTVTATYRFDLKARRLVGLEWKQNEERGEGPVSPAATAEVTTTLERSVVAADEAPEVSDLALVPLPKDGAPEALTQLSQNDPNGRFELLHGREWQFVGRTPQYLVLRLMDRGEFIAQATLSPWKKLPEGKHLTGDEFKEIIAETPGWVAENVLKAEEVKATPNGNWIYQVTAEGEMEGVKALQHFYLVAGPHGEQMLVTFTMTPAQSQKLGTRDLALLSGIVFAGGGAAEKK